MTMPKRIWASTLDRISGSWGTEPWKNVFGHPAVEYVPADVASERDIYRRALERIAEDGHIDIARELARIDGIAVDALIDGDALRDTRDLARADGGSGQSGAGAPTTPPHNMEPDDPPITRQAGERPAD